MNAPLQIKLNNTESQVLYFNGMYKLPVGPYPTINKIVENEYNKLVKTDPSGAEHKTTKEFVIKRLLDFRKTVEDEINEVDAIISSIRLGIRAEDSLKEDPIPYTEIELLTDIADWLHDIIIYCLSEAAKYGLPSKTILDIIMSSNFSKLDENGQPIYDKNGKVLKGPMYWKPEPQIKQLLLDRLNDAKPPQETDPEKAIVWRI